ncbi:MAG TPA: hypothetical protein VIG29_21515, partial [Vicinamibacteria bacterium]
MTRLTLGAAMVLTAPLAAAQLYEPNLPPDHPAIQYREHPAEDPVARLARGLESGASALEFDPRFSYLPSLLDRLDVPADSQTLVFSKTSVQESRI